MNALDVAKALGIAVAVLIFTLAASFPMVAFYAFVIEPGHPQEFYNEAAQWIAPWSSHILGPVAFFAFNYFTAKRSTRRNALLFAAATVALYTFIDMSTLPMMGLPVTTMLTATFALSLLGKAAGALLGAYCGARARDHRVSVQLG